MKEIRPYEKILIQVGILLVFSLLAFMSLVPTLVTYVLVVKLDFSNFMFYSGFILGLFYNFLEFGDFLYRRKPRPKSKVNYFWSILPSSFLLTAFSWYFIIMGNKMLAENKEEAEFFQAVMIAFTVFFLIVKVGKEIKNLYKAYHS